MDIDKEVKERVQELQIYEQNLQNLFMQKQAFQMELNEIESALDEVKKAKEEVYKIAGQIMIKAKKEDVEKELGEKKEILNLRMKSIEKQENLIKGKADEIRREIEEKIRKKK